MEQLCNLALWQHQQVKRDSANRGRRQEVDARSASSGLVQTSSSGQQNVHPPPPCCVAASTMETILLPGMSISVFSVCCWSVARLYFQSRPCGIRVFLSWLQHGFGASDQPCLLLCSLNGPMYFDWLFIFLFLAVPRLSPQNQIICEK